MFRFDEFTFLKLTSSPLLLIISTSLLVPFLRIDLSNFYFPLRRSFSADLELQNLAVYWKAFWFIYLISVINLFCSCS